MTRIVTVLILLLGLAGLATLPAAADETAAAPALLRATVTVEAAVIRLGDLFDGGAPESGLANAEVAVARAPAPGESVVLDARWLSAVARAYDVAWRPASRFDQAVITRASQLVGTETIRATLAADMVARGVEGEFDIQFDGAAPALKLPVDVDPTLTVQQLNLDSQSGRFQAILVATDGQAAARAVVSGRVFALTEVPVPTRRLLPGEVITQADLEWVQVHADRISGATVVDPSQIVGHSPRRPIRAGEPVRANDLLIAMTMKRGTVVTMVLETPQMLITTQGRAMEDGAEGDLVDVMNIASNRVVKATIVDPTTVSVAAASAPLSN